MAGLGFKDFTVGEVLTSADVDGYLMQQTVMRFADAGARGSALGTATGTAVALAEGMVTYLDDQNRVEAYDGTDWLPIGSLLQVVTSTDSTDRSTSSTSLVDASISVSITPRSAVSTLIVEWTGRIIAQQTSGTSSGALLSITNASDTALEGAEQGRLFVLDNNITNPDIEIPFLMRGVVSSASVSSRTYKGRFARVAAPSVTLENASQTGRLVVWEVA